MSESLTRKTVNGSVWSILDVLMRQGIGFIISIVLARLLTPTDYGTIGLVMIFITIANVFVDSGFASGLIRKIDRTENDLSTAFIFNIAVGIVVYIILFIAAPVISDFFDNDALTNIFRVLGIYLVITSFNLVQNAIMIYSMRVKRLAFISATSQISTGIVAIFLAYQGWGVWALVAQQIASALLNAIQLIFATKWSPRLIFDKNSFRYLWGYGSKLLTANLIGVTFSQAYSFIIGKLLGQRNLGLYSRSQNFSQQPVSIITNIINKALVPSLAQCQNDLDRLRNNYKKCVEIISFVIFPLMFILSLAARPVFVIFFGQKWVDAIPLFQILNLGYAFDIFSTLSLQLMNVMGRTDYTLKLEFVKKPIFAFIIVSSTFFGLMGIVVGGALYCLIAALINLSVVKKLLFYNYLSQLIDIVKYAIAAAVILVPTWLLLSTIWNNNWFLLISFPLLSSGLYLGISYVLHFPVLEQVKFLKKNR